MQNLKLLLGVIAGTLILVFGVAVLFSRESVPQSYEQALVVGEAKNAKGAGVKTEVTGSQEATEEAQPETQAKVVVVEFSDLQCPACRGAQPLVNQIMSTYGDQVKLVFRHFPLDQIHKNARAAGIASEAAAEQGKFWEFHDLLFEKQDDWAELPDVREVFVGYAGELGMDVEKFRTDLDRQDMADRVNRDVADGNALGVNATPTFFVNGVKVNTAQLTNAVTKAMNE